MNSLRPEEQPCTRRRQPRRATLYKSAPTAGAPPIGLSYSRVLRVPAPLRRIRPPPPRSASGVRLLHPLAGTIRPAASPANGRTLPFSLLSLRRELGPFLSAHHPTPAAGLPPCPGRCPPHLHCAPPAALCGSRALIVIPLPPPPPPPPPRAPPPPGPRRRRRRRRLPSGPGGGGAGEEAPLGSAAPDAA